MVQAQIERLQKDSEQIEDFIQELTERGDTERAEIFIAKKQHLDRRLSQIS